MAIKYLQMLVKLKQLLMYYPHQSHLQILKVQQEPISVHIYRRETFQSMLNGDGHRK